MKMTKDRIRIEWTYNEEAKKYYLIDCSKFSDNYDSIDDFFTCGYTLEELGHFNLNEVKSTVKCFKEILDGMDEYIVEYDEDLSEFGHFEASWS